MKSTSITLALFAMTISIAFIALSFSCDNSESDDTDDDFEVDDSSGEDDTSENADDSLGLDISDDTFTFDDSLQNCSGLPLESWDEVSFETFICSGIELLIDSSSDGKSSGLFVTLGGLVIKDQTMFELALSYLGPWQRALPPAYCQVDFDFYTIIAVGDSVGAGQLRTQICKVYSNDGTLTILVMDKRKDYGIQEISFSSHFILVPKWEDQVFFHYYVADLHEQPLIFR